MHKHTTYERIVFLLPTFPLYGIMSPERGERYGRMNLYTLLMKMLLYNRGKTS